MADLLIPFDFSENATIALEQSILILSGSDRQLEVLHITNDVVDTTYPKSWNYQKDFTIVKEKVEEVISDIVGRTGATLTLKPLITVKEAATISGGIISQMLETKSKLLVMGTHGSTGIYDKIFGSNTAVLVNHSLFPLLTIPHLWKPVRIEKCVAALKLKKLAALSSNIKSWADFFKCPVEAIQFTISAEAEGEFASKNEINGVPCRLVVNPIETPMLEDIMNFSSTLKNTVLLIFTREKTFLEKLLNPGLGYNLSGRIGIPLLAVPLEPAF